MHGGIRLGVGETARSPALRHARDAAVSDDDVTATTNNDAAAATDDRAAQHAADDHHTSSAALEQPAAYSTRAYPARACPTAA